MYVPSLSSLIAKLYMVAERLLDELVELRVHSWVVKDATGPGALYDYIDNCSLHGNVTGTMTPCGDVVEEQLAGLFNGLLVLASQMTASLIAVEEG